MSVRFAPMGRWALTIFLTLMLILGIMLGMVARARADSTPPAVALLEGVTVSGAANDDQGKPGSWTCEDRAWEVADRFGLYSPESAALGGALPDDYLATVAVFTQARYFHLTLYAPGYGDLIVDVPFGTMERAAGTSYPTGRFDPVGTPSLVYHEQLKIVSAMWGGGGGAGDRGGRIYTWCRILPGSPVTSAHTGQLGAVALPELVAFTASSPATALVDNSVSVYPGPERDGLSGRRACSFLDGIYNMRGEIVDRVIIVTDPLNVEYYRSDPIPELEGYSVQQITCLRSAQTGWLVLTVGGFPVNTGIGQAKTLATRYFIAQPVSYEDYVRGVR